MSIQLFDKTSNDLSRRVSLNYSTSFSLGIKLLSKEYRWAVFATYGFVRLADEIVDTFHGFDKARLLADFKAQTYQSIREGISTNPILHSFQLAANQFGITDDLIEPFFQSMEEDLHTNTHNQKSYDEYIYGSAEVVGLMCLKIFCKGDQNQYDSLLPYARSLGAAFQKVNFLRDIKSDIEERGRLYFPNIDFNNFSDADKLHIIEDVKKDFEHAYIGILKLPIGSRLGVYTAYIYYLKLLQKIERTTASEIMNQRIRIPNSQKIVLLAQSYVREKLMSA
ncbi:MAG: phytoene/squalene synthase family protein [Bacteroidia bacterium]|jgi:phytoene/squalene synthetase|nr:phytoene/squalene synthase family protein [Bacteroidia bacterium]MDA8628822.1 phytoene/squalene synthase family protein [Bacteroidia bacterium]MDA9214180.1 phytoene/squalene synthase family protein [Bacteroidia bacterium]MDB2588461.1 phytoene/squalene synthase family protein [Bacteroidia bacterium]MDG1747802.1 phytoene/squalene synthase family protein [Bacteroidia bacterium]